VALDPKRSEPYFNRGLAAHRLLDFTQAKSDFDEVIRLKPEQAEAYANRGLVLQGMRRYRDAIADFTLALERGEATTKLYFLRARSLRRPRRGEEGPRRGHAP
jgi:tetratricopeptide (TPR) repeat protein